jgi:hypothetical protein
MGCLNTQLEQLFTQNQDLLLSKQVKFENYHMMILSQYHIFELDTINIYSVGKNS